MTIEMAATSRWLLTACMSLWPVIGALAADGEAVDKKIVGHPRYVIAELPRLHPELACTPFGVNDTGTVAGTCEAEWSSSRAVRWTQGVVQDIHPVGASSSGARAINANGEIAGHAFGATRWTAAGDATALAALRGDQASEAYAIAADGSVFGVSHAATDDDRHATLWRRVDPIDLGRESGRSSVITGVAARVAAGSRLVGDYPNDSWRPTLWHAAGPTDLPLLGGFTDCQAHTLNRAGVVVGHCSNGLSWPKVAAMWIGSDVQPLGRLDGTASYPWAINTFGVVVGNRQGFDFVTRGTLWYRGKQVDLDTLLSPTDRQAGWSLRSATAINDHGVIVGVGDCPGRADCALVMRPDIR